MFESIFIAILLVGIIMMILAIYEESIILSSLSILMFFLLAASSMNIEMPYAVANATSDVAITGTYSIFDEALSIVSFAFIFINIILIIKFYKNIIKEKQEKLRFGHSNERFD